MSASLFDVTGRTALVTGASRGIGYVRAAALASAGARFVLNARDPQRLEQARSRLAAEGLRVDVVPFDVTDADAVEVGVASVESSIGAIDILVNNAGMQHRGPFHEIPIDAWRRLSATRRRSIELRQRAHPVCRRRHHRRFMSCVRPWS